MKRILRAAAFSVATIGLAAPAARAEVVQSYHTGTWLIQANATGGVFQNCTATGSYGGGASVMFMLTNRLVWGVAINNPNWNWRTGSKGNLSYWVDGGTARSTQATATGQSRLLILLADSTQLFQEIRLGDRMFFRPDGHGAFSMTLKGTSVALNELLGCVRKYR